MFSFILASEAPNGQIIPADFNEVWWGIAGLAPLLVMFIWKGIPAIKVLLAKRSDRIADELAVTETARVEAEAEVAALRASLGSADVESQRIIAEAGERAAALKADLIARYESEAREAVQRARIEVEASKSQALADLRDEVIGMTVQATEAILSDNLDAASHSQLVDRYIDQVGSPMTAITVYAQAIHDIANAEGTLAQVENELFQVAQLLETNDSLRSALTDSHAPAASRQQVMEDLLRGKASAATLGAVSLVVGAGRAADLPAIARSVLDLGAASRNHAIAEVRSAVPLSDEQRSRLATALKASTGKDVEIKVVIDPTVLGGIVTQIGDTVIDGSVRHRLNRVRETLG